MPMGVVIDICNCIISGNIIYEFLNYGHLWKITHRLNTAALPVNARIWRQLWIKILSKSNIMHKYNTKTFKSAYHSSSCKHASRSVYARDDWNLHIFLLESLVRHSSSVQWSNKKLICKLQGTFRHVVYDAIRCPRIPWTWNAPPTTFSKLGVRWYTPGTNPNSMNL